MTAKRKLNQTVLLILGFIGMTALGINWHFALATWLTPIVLLKYTRTAKTWGFLLFFIVAIIAGAISRSCFVLVDIFALYIINGLFFALPYCLSYLIDKFFYRQGKGFYTTLVYPSAVVFVEYLVAQLMGSWGSIAHTQYPLHSLTQILSITGLFGLSFLVAWFGAIVNWLLENNFNLTKTKKGIFIYGGILLFVFLFGIIRSYSSDEGIKKVKVAAISSEIDIHKLIEDNFETMQKIGKGEKIDFPSGFYSSKEDIDLQLGKTIEAIDKEAKIIAWNEISLILKEQQVKLIKNKVIKLAMDANAYILIAYLEENNSKNDIKPFNNRSVLISPQGKIIWEYKKSALHPDAEAPIINPGDFKIPVLDTKYGRLGTVICYDMEFPDFIRQAGKQSVDIMLVPSYDWEGITPLHPRMASFEAIANGFSLLRPNGKGLATAFDYHGNQIAELNTFDTEEKVLIADLPIKSTNTLYSKIGNSFVFLCVGMLLLFLVLKIISKNED